MTSRSGHPAARLWRGVGLWYLALCLAGLAAGIWPDAILPSKAGERPLPLPTLQTLLLAQVAFFLIVYPLAILRRCEKGDIQLFCERSGSPSPQRDRRATKPAAEDAQKSRMSPFSVVAETLAMLVVAAPFYYAAAYLGDAVVGDVIRSVTALACLLPLSWAAAAWMCRDGFWRPVGAILALTAALGLPAATYLAAEVLKPAWADWLWQFAPATFLWDAAASRQDLLFPRPLWPAAAWLATGAAMLLVMTLARDQATGNGQRATGNNKE